MKKLFITIFSIFLGICAVGVFLFFYNFSSYYSNETDPQKYLEFSLLEDGTYTVKGFKDKPVKDLVIPSKYNGVAVTMVSKHAFHQNTSWNNRREEVKSLTIQEGVKIIGESAFYGCIFQSTKLADSIEKIERTAFQHVQFFSTYKDISLPASLKEIGAQAFSSSTFQGEADLRNVSVGYGVFSYSKVTKAMLSSNVPEFSFFACEKLDTLILEEGVEEIGARAFFKTHIESVSFPDSLKTIHYEAFRETKLKELTLPTSIEEVGRQAFYGCDELKTVELCEYISFDTSTFSICGIEKLVLNDYVATINAGCFDSCPLNEIQIKGDSSKWEIIDHCLVEKTSNKKVLLGGKNCTDLSSFEVIGSSSFSGRVLGNITIPETIAEINSDAFSYAKIEELVIIQEEINSNVFDNLKTKKLTLKCKEIKKNAFEYARIDELIIEEGCEIIREYAFSYDAGFSVVTLPSSIKTVEPNALKVKALLTVYYDYKGSSPTHLTSNCFYYMFSHLKEESDDEVYILDSRFKIYVRQEIYDYCKNAWIEEPTWAWNSSTTIYLKSRLCDYLYVY